MRRGFSRSATSWADGVDDQLRVVVKSGDIATHAVANLQVSYDTVTRSAQVKFTIASLGGVDSFVVKRNISRDPGSAKILANVTKDQLVADGSGLLAFTVSDVDPTIVGSTTYYWVDVVAAANPAVNSQLVGPQALQIPAAGALGVPNQALLFDAWESAGAGGVVTIGVQVKPADLKTASIKIYISGYEGNAAYVAIAQSATWPFSFTLLQTSEAITLKAIAVTLNGDEAAAGPTKNLTLNGTATAPAEVVLTDVAELTTGVQIGWVGGRESDLTTYQIWRAQRNAGFGAASNIGTVAPSGASHYTFLDTAGLGGQYEWYVVAVNAAGSSAASPVIWPGQASLTSADSVPNEPQNNTNQATVDSIDAGTNATIRVYGTGGTSSDWTRTTGYGSETYPHAALTGFNYSTTYYVMYDKKNAVYVVTTSPLNIMPDNYVWAGKLTTGAAGGGGGTGGGGGGTGGSGGGRGLL